MASFADAVKSFNARTTLERCLLVFVFVLSIVLIVFIVVAFLPKAYGPDSSSKNVCRSRACRKIGSAILQSMDRQKNPCENFYEYSCGGWIKKQSVPSDIERYGVLQVLREDVLRNCKDILSSPNESDTWNIGVSNARKFYNSCMDSEAIDEQSVNSLLEFLDELGGWPLASKNWTADNYDVMDVIAETQRRTSVGFGIMFTFGADEKDPPKNVISLESQGLLFSTKILLDPTSKDSHETLHHYQQFFTTVVRLVAASTDINPDKDFQDMVDLETIMAKLLTIDVKKKNARMKIADLQLKIPGIRWLTYLQKLTNTTLLTLGENAVITLNDEVIINDMPYMEGIGSYLTDPKRKRQIANYVSWRLLMSRIKYLPKEFMEAANRYYDALGFPEYEQPPRWKMCVSETVTAFSEPVSFLYIRKHFREEVKNEVMKLVLDLRYQFENSLMKISWMDIATRKAALKKLFSMDSNIGYPESLSDETVIQDRYISSEKPNMTGNIIVNDLALAFHKTKEAILKFRKVNVKQLWATSPVTVNADYRKSTNAITFPAAFLQPPMYNTYAPKFYNYATIGSIIGHEITHGFDNEGRKWNSSGEINNWWSRDSEKAFIERSQCFIEQYQSYGLNGTLTLAENIADSGGIRQAYREFIRWKRKQQSILSLPGLEGFSIEQQFFLSYGSIWCTKYKDSAWNSSVLLDNHPPSPYRVIGSLSNLPEFSKAFNCHQNEFKKNCVIW